MSTMTSEREAFEKWMHDVMLYPPTDLVFQDARNCYADYATHLACKAWEARAHLAQPARAVDVGAVRRVIDGLNGYCEASDDSCYGTLATSLVRGYTEQLARALTGEKAGRDADEVTATDFATALRNCGLSLATYAMVDREARRLAKQRALLPASPAPDKEGQS